jgi:hypothetical protein
MSRLTPGHVRQILSRGVLPELSVETVGFFVAKAAAAGRAVELLGKACGAEPATSFARENAGAISVRCIDRAGAGGGAVLKHMVLPADSLTGRRLTDVRIENCYIYRTRVAAGTLTNSRLASCSIERLDLDGERALERTSLIDCTVGAVSRSASDHPVFNPDEVRAVLLSAGAILPDTAPTGPPPDEAGPYDEDLALSEKVFYKFLRATQLNEGVVRQSLGTRANRFIDDVLPHLVRVGVVDEVQYVGSGKQRRFRLALPLREVQDACAHSKGSFNQFLVNAASRRAR